MANRVLPSDNASVDEHGNVTLDTVLTEQEVSEEYAEVNLHNDSPYSPYHGEGQPATLVPRKDELGRIYLAQKICHVIHRTRPPLTVGVYGRWGDGKTNILAHVKQILSAGVDGGVAERTVWFNVWEHQNDVNPVIAMLQTARAEAARKHWSGINDAAIAALDTSIDDLVRACAWTALDVAMPNVVSVVSKFRAQKQRIMTERMAIQDEQSKLRSKFHNVLDSLAGETKVVFFIDDLDRCLPANLVDLLEKIRLFMDHDKCVFVIGADSQAVAQAIREVKKYSSDEWAAHYLEKMVQISFEIPPIDIDNKHQFVLSLLRNVKDHKPGMLDEDTDNAPGGSAKNRKVQIAKLMEAAFDEQDATVRLIITTVNGFAVDHLIGRGHEPFRDGRKWRIDGYDPRVMAVMTIIKKCYPLVYEGLRKRHKERPDLLELLFRMPEVSSLQAGPWVPTEAANQSAEDKAVHEFFDKNGSFLSHARGFLSSQIAEDLGPEKTKSLLSGDNLNKYFELGGSSAIGSIPVSSNKTPAVSETGNEPTPTTAQTQVIPDEEAKEEAVPIEEPPLVTRSSRRVSPGTDSHLEAIRTEIKEKSLRASRVLLDQTLAGYQFRLLARQGGRALLLSEQILMERAYHSENMRVTWEVCDLRRYLNADFYFSLPQDVQQAIQLTQIDNPDNPVWSTLGGNPTRDYIFLLNLQETMQYLCKGEKVDAGFWDSLRDKFYDRLSSRLIAKDRNGAPGWWWLRSPGVVSSFAANVYADGALSGNGRHGGVSAIGGVRPAFWLSLD